MSLSELPNCQYAWTSVSPTGMYLPELFQLHDSSFILSGYFKQNWKNCALKKWLQFHIQLPETDTPLRWLFKMHTTPKCLLIFLAFPSLTHRHTHMTISRINWISAQFLTLRTVLTSNYLVPWSLALNADMKILNPRNTRPSVQLTDIN